jgi:hypothetical protein
MVKSQVSQEASISDHIKQFINGRGTTILMAIIAFVVVYFLLQILWKLVLLISNRKQDEKRTYFQRMATIIYHMATVALSITAIFYILNVRNDRVLFAIAVLLLISIIWVLKNSLPRYFNEFQLLLNAGSVREGELLIYNGVPMKVGNLNFYTKLTNPALPGLLLRLSLSDLTDYTSRPHNINEPWFPCKEGDYVMLSDGSYGKVKFITLENVVLSLYNGMMPQTYAINAFLAAKPKNLSQGFIVTSIIGIDYKYQQQCTAQIPELLRSGIRHGLQQEIYGGSLNDIWVYFEQANTSSLDYKIIVVFDGKAADEYYPITRALQRYAVEVCNQQQWNIPFSQLEIHYNKN